MNPITLIYDEVVAKAREYYEAGKLTAQHPRPRSRVCQYYGDDGHRCAVGAALPDKLEVGNFFYGIRALHRQGYVVIKDEEVELICDFQNAHDNWCIENKHYGVILEAGKNPDAHDVELTRAAFKKLIYPDA